MTPEEQLVVMTGGDAEPQLTSDELAKCLLDAAIPDSSGNFVNDEAWVPHYDLNRAASNGWILKAGKVATDYDITIEQRELHRSQMIENFLKLAQTYLRKAQPRMTTASGLIEPWRV
jgi:hypothetical protein